MTSQAAFLDSALYYQVTVLSIELYILQLPHSFIWNITVEMDEFLFPKNTYFSCDAFYLDASRKIRIIWLPDVSK